MPESQSSNHRPFVFKRTSAASRTTRQSSAGKTTSRATPVTRSVRMRQSPNLSESAPSSPSHPKKDVGASFLPSLPGHVGSVTGTFGASSRARLSLLSSWNEPTPPSTPSRNHRPSGESQPMEDSTGTQVPVRARPKKRARLSLRSADQREGMQSPLTVSTKFSSAKRRTPPSQRLPSRPTSGNPAVTSKGRSGTNVRAGPLGPPRASVVNR